MTVGFCHIASCSGTCLTGLCLPPGWKCVFPSPQAGVVLLSPSQPIACRSSTLAIKLTYLFVFFLSGYLELEAMVAIEICGQSDALLLWDGGTTWWAGLWQTSSAKGAGCRQGRQFENRYLPVPTQHSLDASEMGLVSGVSS